MGQSLAMPNSCDHNLLAVRIHNQSSRYRGSIMHFGIIIHKSLKLHRAMLQNQIIEALVCLFKGVLSESRELDRPFIEIMFATTFIEMTAVQKMFVSNLH